MMAVMGRVVGLLLVMMGAVLSGCADEGAGVASVVGDPTSVSAPANPSQIDEEDGSSEMTQAATEGGASSANPGPITPVTGPVSEARVPLSFVAVTTDFVAVEIDTGSGAEVRTIESLGDGSDGSDNVIEAVWWDPAEGNVIVSAAPEPAGGALILLEANQTFERSGQMWSDGWDAAVSPDGRLALTIGYQAQLKELKPRAGDGLADPIEIAAIEDGLSFTPAWLRDRRGVAFSRMASDDDGWPSIVELVELDAENQVIARKTHAMTSPLADLEVRADGKLIVLVADAADRSISGWAGSQALVIDPDSGELITEFALEPGSHSLSYDNTGTYLLYVDGDGAVRWQGAGERELIGGSYLWADW